MKLTHVAFCLFLIFVSCKKEEVDCPVLNYSESMKYEYLHISHTRTSLNPLIDSVAEKINYNRFDILMLGGDLAYLTSKDIETMSHVDSIFDIGNPNTLWSLGNHDYSNLNLIEAYTKRPPFYAYNKNGITFIVLDTQDSISSITSNQLKLFNTVTDTMVKSTHLILLTHKLIWMYDNEELEPQIDSVSNGPLGNCSYCVNPNNFYEDVYPKLVTIQNRGIKVMCIGGDIGFKASEFEYKTEDGIQFLASGIKFNSPESKAILFTHDITTGLLSWTFEYINEL